MATSLIGADTLPSSENDCHTVGKWITNRRSTVLDSNDDSRPTQKRKASEPSTVTKPTNTRQKITRACDHCKEKKTRCTGTLPCMRCTRLSLPCEYNAAYSRGLPPKPPPAPPSVVADYTSQNHAHSPAHTNRSASSQPSTRSCSRNITCSRQQSENGAEISGRNSPDPVVTDFEGNYLGPASGLSFLNRVWRRLHQDEIRAIPGELRREPSSKSTSVFMFGDRPYSDSRQAGFTLPSFTRAQELVEAYFDFSMVTYRFLHRGTVGDWLKQVYESNISSLNPPVGPMVARTAIILNIFALSSLYVELNRENDIEVWNGSERWYATSKYLLSLESGPPRLESVQARLGQCLYLLSSSRANECWYAFGTALQLVTALGLHRRYPAQLSKNGNTYLEREIRKRIFWSTYTLDKYLSAMFGRPRLIHDEDHDQDLPDEVNDEDMLEDDVHRRMGSPDCMMIASVLHYKLGRVLGEVSRQLYTINPRSREPPLEAAVRLTSELEEWKKNAPPLFNSVRATSLIPPLCRQSQVLQLAYSHAIIHATRSCLLNNFIDLSRQPPVSHPVVTSHVRKCIGAAEDVMKIVNTLGEQGVLTRSFWFTQYVCFCAITVVYIYTIQQCQLSSYPGASQSTENKKELRSLFDLAETCQRHLAEASRKNCPSRRYSIILEELRVEARRHAGSYPYREAAGQTPQDVGTTDVQNQDSMTQRYAHLAGPQQPPAPTSASASHLDTFPPPGPVAESFGLSEDLALLDTLEGLNWWTQLDSWAFSNPSTEPSDLAL
ncbi:fungal-specific transcription factor domain-containing protein [Aspergillus coremiiformis]|uniref:Fungal-specific transcription factor domain-containing protein n=1 Tax=Aspergillus coremiiformis TaxID=138285 RepID=A0A5N6ZK20_9EURO|nr:fungal-specific transcription factor domain-containing protein [Aspergillus coremiiformis]